MTPSPGSSSNRVPADRTESPAAAPAIILVTPQMGENIGAAARAMLNCGLTDLRLVAPRDGWPNIKAERAAVGALELMPPVRIFDTVAEAVSDLTLVFATTARDRKMVKPIVTARRAAADARAHAAGGGKVGFLFGPERTGLLSDDITLANTLITVPLNPDFTSLNLGQAVLLVGYEWFQAVDETPGREDRYGWSPPADKELLQNFFRMLEHELDECGFLRNTEKRPSMVRNIRNMFQRSGLSEQELRTLHGMIACLTDWRAEPDVLGEPVRRRRKRKSEA